MLNQEQLAAIAAAMSILQQSMQSNNSPNGTVPAPQSTTISPLLMAQQLAAATDQLHQHQAQQPQHHHQQQQHHLNHHHHHQQQQQQHHHHQLPIGNSTGTLHQQSNHQFAGFASLAQMEAALAASTASVIQDHAAHQHDHHHHNQPTAVANMAQAASHRIVVSSAAGNSETSNSGATQHALVNQYHSHFEPSNLNLAPSPPKQVSALPHTYKDILTNNLTSTSLGQTNGSSIIKQQNSNDSMEPTLSYTIDHSTPPAQQLFNSTQHNLLRQNQLQFQKQQQQQQQQQQQNQLQIQKQQQIIENQNTYTISNSNNNNNNNITSRITPPHGSATNLLGFMGLYVGNLSPDLTKEQLEKIFSKYGEPVKAHRLIRSPVAFIKYENTESPRAAIDDLYGLLLPDLTLNQDQPLKLHFDRNDAQLKANYRPIELPKEDNGECYGWRTTVCRRGKNCPKKHIPINRGIDFQMWMIKSTPTTSAS